MAPAIKRYANISTVSHIPCEKNIDADHASRLTQISCHGRNQCFRGFEMEVHFEEDFQR